MLFDSMVLRSSALATRKKRRGELAYDVARERLRPSASMEGFISEIVIVELGELLMLVAWSRSRNAMSPVPPAMSSIVQPGESVVEEEPGLRLRTKWSLFAFRFWYFNKGSLKGNALPQSVDSKRHEVVHCVVGGCYIAEDASD